MEQHSGKAPSLTQVSPFGLCSVQSQGLSIGICLDEKEADGIMLDQRAILWGDGRRNRSMSLALLFNAVAVYACCCRRSTYLAITNHNFECTLPPIYGFHLSIKGEVELRQLTQMADRCFLSILYIHSTSHNNNEF